MAWYSVGVTVSREMVRLSVDLPQELMKRVEEYCADAQRSQASAVRYALARLVREWEESRG